MDRFSFMGLVLGIGALFGTQLIEGGHPASMLQGPAAIVVFVGTLGATLLSSSARDIGAALRELRLVFRPVPQRNQRLVELYRDLAFMARKDGLVALEKLLPSLPTAFMKRAMRHVIDGCDERQLEDILEADIRTRSNQSLAAAEVFEIAGGYAPTMGILGAVLGLIRAMESLANPDALGAGIAVAFIATIYGGGGANLLLLPVAAMIRQRTRQQEDEDEIVATGAVGLQTGVSPRTLERLLSARLAGDAKP
jgi:chemotaxis protein MotA